MNEIDDWLLAGLVCPRDKKELSFREGRLECGEGHAYAVIDGIPVLLFDDGQPTHGYIRRTLDQVERITSGENPQDVLWQSSDPDGTVDEFVQAELPYTCGNLYFSVQHKLTRYPFPEVRLEKGSGQRLLDVGCNWGRWTLAAAQLGYRPVGIDPCLDAVLAARRIARQLGADAHFLVADGRYLPFRDGLFEIGFSNGVFQHLKKVNAIASLKELSRVVSVGGRTVIQMANRYGVRSMYQQSRLGFKEGAEGADVIYWSPSELVEAFNEVFGETKLSADCYFGLNVQGYDIDIMPPRFKTIIRASEFVRGMSARVPPLVRFADSVYLHSVNQKMK